MGFSYSRATRGLPANPSLTPQPSNPQNGTGFGSHIASALNGMQPQTNQAFTPQPLQSGMFPRLQALGAQGGMGGFLSQFMMHTMRNKQMESGLSPEDFQAQIEARRAAHRAARGF